MTGVFEDPPLGSAEFIFSAPGRIPYRRILNLELIEDAVRPEPSEPFGDRQFLPSAAQGRLLRKVGGLDHQGRALIPTNGVAHPGSLAVGSMFAADMNNAHV